MRRYTFAIVLLVLITKGCCGMYQGETEEEMLSASAARNNWGQAFNLYNNAAASVLNVDLPAWMARPWTLNLLRYRYSGGPLASGVGVASNPDAQTVGDDTKVRIDYGVDGALESVLVDYPRQGGTLQFHAAVIRVYFIAPAIASTSLPPGGIIPLSPLVGAFLTPHARGQLTDWQPPTLTLPGVAVATAPASSYVQVPVRAKAYRLTPVPGAGTLGNQLTVFQCTGTGARFGQDYSGETIGVEDFAGPPAHIYMFRENWIPLEHNIEQLELQSSGAAQNVRPQFLIDLG